jgi:hypothetical protein
LRPVLFIWDAAVNALPTAPADQTLIQQENGSVWMIAGVAKFHVPDPATLNRLFGRRAVTDMHHRWTGVIGKLPLIPADGTILHEEGAPLSYGRQGREEGTGEAGNPGHVVALEKGALNQIPGP